ncbi:MAG: Flp pilus assembly complex ATPase component TadA [Labilithrix sp.]|nr:Flp pilus assembly complex ATPase component TadA [Labilithrix sp.]
MFLSGHVVPRAGRAATPDRRARGPNRRAAPFRPRFGSSREASRRGAAADAPSDPGLPEGAAAGSVERVSRPGALGFEAVCKLLVQARVLSAEHAREALIREERERARLIRARAGRPQRHPRGALDAVIHPAEVIAAMELPHAGNPEGKVGEKTVMEVVARAANLPFVELDPLKIDAKLAPQLISRPFARRHTALVIAAEEGSVTVAVADPYDRGLVDDLVQYVKRRPTLVVSTPSDIQRLITDFYGFRVAVAGAEEQAQGLVDIGNLERYVKLKRVEDIEANDQHVVNAVEYLLHYALDQRASDIHIEPQREQSVVRMRIDGVLHKVHTLPKVVHPAVLSRIKMLARMDIAERRRPQDGRIKTERGQREVELRVSTISVAFGEKMVIRVFDPENVLRDLGELGMTEPQLEAARAFFGRPNGLVLVTGPTGSGKTSSLYAALRMIASPELNVVTIEDPIEIVLDSLNQVSVDKRIGLGFAEALRHVLRQDPDVVMVGEVRDEETAQIATQAALTGHLVLATLHTNDSATAITRLIELGVDPFILSSTLVGVVAQRLVRLVCAGCRVDTFLTTDQMSMLGLDVDALAAAGQEPQLMVAAGEGCVKCRGTGLLRRTGVFEVLVVDDKIRKLVIARAGSREILNQAKNDGLMTLREAALRKLGKGLTTFEEVLRVTVEE